MTQESFGKAYAGTGPENYERYFVPAIGAPVAEDLMKSAALRPGEHVLDVACGTGVVARLAAREVGESGKVAGLDLNACMLKVARSVTPPGISIDWYETSAEAMPLPDASFDAVLCQMGLQFFSNKLAALREMHRILKGSGRIVINVPGPTPPLFAVFADVLAKHIDPKVAAFAHVVFSLHDADELRELVSSAGFTQVNVQVETKTLRLPKPVDFLWQYIHSTPLAGPVGAADEHAQKALERELTSAWQDFVVDGHLSMSVGISTVTARA